MRPLTTGPILGTLLGATCMVWAPGAHAAPTVAIDVGHSRQHPGSISARGKSEFEFNRALAQTIGQTLSAQGTPHMLIGTDGLMTSLKMRTQAAQNAGAGLLLSVHHDSAQLQYFDHWVWQGVERRYSDRFAGYSLFVSRKNPAPDASLQCARALGAKLKLAGLTPSPHHAENIPGENRPWADEALGVYYYDDLVVLKTATSPAVLIEAGIIVNRTEEANLDNPATRDKIAHAIAQGFHDCLPTP